MLRFHLPVVALLLLAACGTREVPPIQSADTARGGLLYETQCVECHTTQPHWRDKRIVQSWEGLVVQVERWQRVAGLRWSGDDVRDVAGYLNERFYKMPAPGRS